MDNLLEQQHQHQQSVNLNNSHNYNNNSYNKLSQGNLRCPFYSIWIDQSPENVSLAVSYIMWQGNSGTQYKDMTYIRWLQYGYHEKHIVIAKLFAPPSSYLANKYCNDFVTCSLCYLFAGKPMGT